MFTNVKGFWGFAGVGLALVALYLVLTNAMGAKAVIDSAGSQLTHVYSTLQGRSV